MTVCTSLRSQDGAYRCLRGAYFAPEQKKMYNIAIVANLTFIRFTEGEIWPLQRFIALYHFLDKVSP